MSAYNKEALDLMLSDAENRKCIDCGTPSPQWASLSYAVYICLICSGVHRSLGVHISFVRSLTMDKWKEEQISKMRMGGNAKCREFFESSAEYSSDMSIADKYNAYFAMQYKDKLSAEVEGRSWGPSDTPRPAPYHEPTSSLRKPRATTSRTSNTASQSTSRSSTPSMNYNSNEASNANESQKSRNEDFFASMGSANDTRREDLPPSQGGKYAGFGSDASYHPTSSRALPSVDDFRDDPMSALGKGWGVFGAALRTASKTINESVVQPTLDRAADPALQSQFHSQFTSYVSKASTALTTASRVGGSVLASGLSSGSEILREQGYNVGDLGSGYVERATGRGAGEGYGKVGETEAPMADEGDFFATHIGASGADGGAASRYGNNSNRGLPGLPEPEVDASSNHMDSYSTASASSAAGVEDGWAKLAPASAAAASRESRSSSPAIAAPASARATTHIPAKKVVPKKDDWDDFGTDDWKN